MREWGGRGQGEKRTSHYSYFITRTILSHRKWNVSSTSAWSSHAVLLFFILLSLAPFKHSNLMLFIPYKSGAVSEVAEVEFSWQTSTKHQHRIYKYISISIHCKISPTMSRGWKQVVSTESTSWIRSLECQVFCLITSYIHSSNLSTNAIVS